MAYSKQTWDTTSYINPTRMNHIEDGIDQALPKDGGTMTGDLTLGKQSTVLKIRAAGSRYTNITSGASGSDKDVVFPNKSGTVAMLDDIPTPPTANYVMVVLPTTAQYGYYFFFLPTTAFKKGKTVTITSAVPIGSSTNLKDYVSYESYPVTELGAVYKIASSVVSGGSAVLITFDIS